MRREKRSVPRFIVEWPMRLQLPWGQWVRGHTINVSTSGLLFHVAVDIDAEGYADLEICTQRLETIRCRVYVTREAEADTALRHYGAEFVEMTREDCLRLAQRLMALPPPALNDDS